MLETSMNILQKVSRYSIELDYARNEKSMHILHKVKGYSLDYTRKPLHTLHKVIKYFGEECYEHSIQVKQILYWTGLC